MEKRLKLSNNFVLKKCRRREDLISQLPDDALVHVLSFLSVKEAADTSVVSKRWLRLWTYISRLDFDATEPLYQVLLNNKLRKRHMKKYVRWVNHTLQLCKVERLDQFRVRFDLDKSTQHDIDKWLEFAFARQVQRLELDLLEDGEDPQDLDYCYTFPDQLLNTFRPFSVKKLLLNSVNVTGDALEFFLHNCPFLEELQVHGSGTLVNLEVVGPCLKLKHLVIWYCPNLESLKIHDTNLVTLRTQSGHQLLLSNVPMLIEVDLSGQLTSSLDDIWPRFSCVLSQLEVLKITTQSVLEYLGHYKVPHLTKLKKFEVCVYAFGDESVLGCTHVIEAAPLLKEFELKLLKITMLRSKRERTKVVSCPLHHLKIVRLWGYYGRTSELELAMYFLENAIVLEKIIIDPRPQFESRRPLRPKEIEMMQMSRNLAKLQLEGQVPSHIELVIL